MGCLFLWGAQMDRKWLVLPESVMAKCLEFDDCTVAEEGPTDVDRLYAVTVGLEVIVINIDSASVGSPHPYSLVGGTWGA